MTTVEKVVESVANRRISKTLQNHLNSCDISSTGLAHIPDDLLSLSSLISLNLSSNSLSQLPDGISNLKALSVIDLGKNLLSQIPMSFKELSCLRVLYLNDNEFGEFPSVLEHILSLAFLRLDGNKISKVPDWIGKLTNLEMISLRMNKIRTLPSGFLELRKLRIVHIQNNLLASLPEASSDVPSSSCSSAPTEEGADFFPCLQEFLINNNSLSTLPNWIRSLTHLRQVSYHDNNWVEPFQSWLSEGFEFCVKKMNEEAASEEVKAMALAESSVTSVEKTEEEGEIAPAAPAAVSTAGTSPSPVPAAASSPVSSVGDIGSPAVSHKVSEPVVLKSSVSLKNSTYCNAILATSLHSYIKAQLEVANMTLELKLRDVSLNGVVFDDITKQAARKLERVKLKKCSLTEVPPFVWNCRRAKVLCLSTNGIETLSKKMQRLKFLEDVHFTENRLRSIGSFCLLPYLQVLRLDGNQITRIPPEIHSLSSLRELSLNRNAIKEVPKEIGGLLNLSILNLSSNRIKSLTKSIGMLVKLDTLRLGSNLLSELPIEMRYLTNLSTLDISANPLRCPYLALEHENAKVIVAKISELHFSSSERKETSRFSDLRASPTMDADVIRLSPIPISTSPFLISPSASSMGLHSSPRSSSPYSDIDRSAVAHSDRSHVGKRGSLPELSSSVDSPPERSRRMVDFIDSSGGESRVRMAGIVMESSSSPISKAENTIGGAKSRSGLSLSRNLLMKFRRKEETPDVGSRPSLSPVHVSFVQPPEESGPPRTSYSPTFPTRADFHTIRRHSITSPHHNELHRSFHSGLAHKKVLHESMIHDQSDQSNESEGDPQGIANERKMSSPPFLPTTASPDRSSHLMNPHSDKDLNRMHLELWNEIWDSIGSHGHSIASLCSFHSIIQVPTSLSATPSAVTIPTSFRDVLCGNSHVSALSDDGQIFLIPLPFSSENSLYHLDIPFPALRIAAGGNSIIATFENGSVYHFWIRWTFRSEDSITTDVHPANALKITPVLVKRGIATEKEKVGSFLGGEKDKKEREMPVIGVSAARQHSAYWSANEFYCWGVNSAGETGFFSLLKNNLNSF